MAQIREWVALLGTLYDQYGYALVLVGTLTENTALLGLVMPGNTMALLGAFYARQGTLNLGWVIMFAWLGTVLGYHVDYLIGRYALDGLMQRWSTTRLGRRVRLAGRMRLARGVLSRHGGKAILLSHIIGHVRSFVALAAGATRMRYRRFLAFELVAALIWSTAYCLIGYLIGSQWETLQLVVERAGLVVIAGLLLAFVVWRLVRQRRSAARDRARRIRQRARLA